LPDLSDSFSEMQIRRDIGLVLTFSSTSSVGYWMGNSSPAGRGFKICASVVSGVILAPYSIEWGTIAACLRLKRWVRKSWSAKNTNVANKIRHGKRENNPKNTLKKARKLSK
jgi:hypothetical protein